MRYPKHITAALVGLAITSLALSGCANREPVADVPSASAPGDAAPTTPPVEPGIIEITTQPGTESDFVGAIKDTEVTECTSGPDGANFSGTVTNPEASAQSYRIYVSMMSGTKTLGIKEVNVDNLEPNEKATWAGSLATTASDAKCILRVERTAAE